MRIAARFAAVVALAAGLGWWSRETPRAASAPERAAPSPRAAAVSRTVPAIREVVRQRDLPATDWRYDPVIRVREEPGLVRAEEIYDGEPRDPTYAPVFERRVRTQLARALAELGLENHVQQTTVDCRTLSCQTVLEVDPAAVMTVYELVNGIMLGDSQSPDFDAANGRVTITTLYRGDARGEDYHARFNTEAFEPALAWAKQRQAEAAAVQAKR